MVTVPRQVPVRNDCPPDGAVGLGEEPPHAEVIINATTAAPLSHVDAVIPTLLWPLARRTRTGQVETDRSARRTRERSSLVSPAAVHLCVPHARPGGWRARWLPACCGAASRRWPSRRSAPGASTLARPSSRGSCSGSQGGQCSTPAGDRRPPVLALHRPEFGQVDVVTTLGPGQRSSRVGGASPVPTGAARGAPRTAEDSASRDGSPRSPL